MPSPEPGAFKDWSRPKPHMVPILEAAIDPHLRVAALRALVAFRMPRPRELRQRFLSQVAISRRQSVRRLARMSAPNSDPPSPRSDRRRSRCPSSTHRRSR